MNHMPSVLVRLEGGLGNQLFQYTAGRALALHTGRTLLLDRSPIARQPHGRSYELHAFAIVEQFVAPPELLAIRAAHSPRLPSFMRQAARYISRRSWSVLRDPGTGFDPSIVNLSGNVVLEGGWQYSEYARQIAPQLRRDLAPRFSMSPKLATVAQAIHESQSVCLHVRRGDYITDPHVHAVHGVQPPDYFNAAAQLLANRLREPVFFVFSEDLDWAESHLSIPGKAWFVRESAGLPP